MDDPATPHPGPHRRPRRAAPGLQQLPRHFFGTANTIGKQLLADAPPSTLDPAIIEAVDALDARREREITAAPEINS